MKPTTVSVTTDHPHRKFRQEEARAVVDHVALAEKATVDSLSVVLTGHEVMRRLNKVHLDREYDTDVLAFDLRDDPTSERVDGEIYVDMETALERASEFSATVEEEIFRYIIHGFLHLVGYRDDSPERVSEMRKREDQLLIDFLSRQ